MLELSQRELAERAGIGEKHLGEIERGLRDPRLSTLLRLLDALGLAPAEIAAFWTEALGFRPSYPWRGAYAPGGDSLAYGAGSEAAHERGGRDAEAAGELRDRREARLALRGLDPGDDGRVDVAPQAEVHLGHALLLADGAEVLREGAEVGGGGVHEPPACGDLPEAAIVKAAGFRVG
jgi:transcriptional regulator with XRE-family HTH domain